MQEGGDQSYLLRTLFVTLAALTAIEVTAVVLAIASERSPYVGYGRGIVQSLPFTCRPLIDYVFGAETALMARSGLSFHLASKSSGYAASTADLATGISSTVVYQCSLFSCAAAAAQHPSVWGDAAIQAFVRELAGTMTIAVLSSVASSAYASAALVADAISPAIAAPRDVTMPLRRAIERSNPGWLLPSFPQVLRALTMGP